MMKIAATGLVLLASLLLWLGLQPLATAYNQMQINGWLPVIRDYVALTPRLDSRSRQTRAAAGLMLVKLQPYINHQWNQARPLIYWSFGVLLVAIVVWPWSPNAHYRISWSRLPRSYSRTGILVGRTGLFGDLVFVPPTTHALVTAPSGTGKTATLIHALLHWRGGAVVTDPKGELYASTARWREAMGQEIHCWSAGPAISALPLAALFGSNLEALAALTQLVVRRDERAAPFVAVAENVIAALLIDATHRQLPPWTTVAQTSVGCWEEALRQIADDTANPGWRHARNALAAAQGANFWGSVAGSASVLMGTIQSLAPGLDAAGTDEINFSKSTVYVVISESNDSQLLAARWLLAGLYRAFQVKRPPHAVAWLLDEAGALRLPFLADIVRVGRGRNIGVVAFTQSISDLHAAYGEHETRALIAALNGPLVMYKPHSADSATTNMLVNAIEPFTELAGEPRKVHKFRGSVRQFLHKYVVTARHGYILTRELGCARINPAPFYSNRQAARVVRWANVQLDDFEPLPHQVTRPRPLPKTTEPGLNPTARPVTKRRAAPIDLSEI